MSFGKILITIGLVILLIGIIVLFFERFFPLGKLPGDIRIERDGLKIYIPIVSAILVSLILTILLNIIFFIFKK